MNWLRKRSSLIVFSTAIVLIGAAHAHAVGGIWNVDADGDWSNAGNWLSGTIADGTDSTATFNINNTAPRTVSVDTARVIGNLFFEDASGDTEWIIAGPNPLTMSVTTGRPTIRTEDTARISAVLAGSNGLRFAQDGTIKIQGTNTYTGTTILSSSTLQLDTNVPNGSPGALGNSTSAVVIGDASTGSQLIGLLTDAAITFDRNIHVTNNGNGIVYIGANDPSVTNSTFNGDIQLDRDVILFTGNGNVATFNGVISGVGGIGRTGNSFNIAILNGTNTYTGDTNISFGHIYVGSDALLNTPGALGNSSSVINIGGNGGVLTNGAFTVAREFKVNGATAVFGGVTTGNSFFTGDIEMNAGSELTAAAGGKVTFSGELSGSGGFTKTGSGTVAVTGNNTYSGNTSLALGLLQLGSNTALGTGSISVGSFGTGFEAIGGPRTIANDWDYLRPPTFEGTNDLTFTGDGNLSANFQLGLAFNSTGVTTFSGPMSSSAGFAFAKSGVGDMVLSGNNNYVGVTTVSSGRLIAASNNALGGVADNTVVASGATLGFQGNINYTTTEGVSVSGAGVSSQGAINNISGNNTFAGVVTTTGATTLGATAGMLHLTGNIVGGNAINITGAGTVALDGNVAASSVNVDATGTLGGSGVINTGISGAGMVAPGASPGILTAAQVSPSGGLDFSFEFTSTAPNYVNALASDNDVLRLTNGTTPFASALNASNEIDVYFNITNFTDGNYTGGFYTDRNSAFDAELAGATFNYYARVTGGSVSYLGNQYELLSTAYPGAAILFSTINPAGTQFGGQDGYVMQFSVSGLPAAPEPSSMLLLSCGALALVGRRRKSR
jgi:fibronectin-binding autotransporter adhesin